MGWQDELMSEATDAPSSTDGGDWRSELMSEAVDAPRPRDNFAQRALGSMSEVPILGPVASAVAHPSEFLSGVVNPSTSGALDLGAPSTFAQHPMEAAIANKVVPFLQPIPVVRSIANANYKNTDFERQHPYVNMGLNVVGGTGEFLAGAEAAKLAGAAPWLATVASGALTGAAGGGVNPKAIGLGAAGGAIAHGVGAASAPLVESIAAKSAPAGMAALVASQGAAGVAASAPELAMDPGLRDLLMRKARGEKLTPEEETAANHWIASQAINAVAGSALGVHSAMSGKSAAAKAEADALRPQAQAAFDEQMSAGVDPYLFNKEDTSAGHREYVRKQEEEAFRRQQQVRDEHAAWQRDQKTPEEFAGGLGLSPAEQEASLADSERPERDIADEVVLERERQRKAAESPEEPHDASNENAPTDQYQVSTGPEQSADTMSPPTRAYPDLVTRAENGNPPPASVLLQSGADREPSPIPVRQPSEDFLRMTGQLPPKPDAQPEAGPYGRNAAVQDTLGTSAKGVEDLANTQDAIRAGSAKGPLTDAVPGAQPGERPGQIPDRPPTTWWDKYPVPDYLTDKVPAQMVANPTELKRSQVQGWLSNLEKTNSKPWVQDYLRDVLTQSFPEDFTGKVVAPADKSTMLATKSPVPEPPKRIAEAPPVAPQPVSGAEPTQPTANPVPPVESPAPKPGVSRETIGGPEPKFSQYPPGATKAPDPLAEEAAAKYAAKTLGIERMKNTRVEFVDSLNHPKTGNPVSAMLETRPDGSKVIRLSRGAKDFTRETLKEAGRIWEETLSPVERGKWRNVDVMPRLRRAIAEDRNLTPDQRRSQLALAEADPHEARMQALQYQHDGTFHFGTWFKNTSHAFWQLVERLKNVITGTRFEKGKLLPTLGEGTTGEDLGKALIGGKYASVRPGENLKTAENISNLIGQHVQGAVSDVGKDTASPLRKAYGKVLSWTVSSPAALGADLVDAIDRVKERHSRSAQRMGDLLQHTLGDYRGSDEAKAKIESFLKGDQYVDETAKKEVLKAPLSKDEATFVKDGGPAEEKNARLAEVYNQRMKPLYDEARRQTTAALERLKETDPKMAEDALKIRREIDYGSKVLEGKDVRQNIALQTLDRPLFDASKGSASEAQRTAAIAYLHDVLTGDVSKGMPEGLTPAQKAVLESTTRRIMYLTDVDTGGAKPDLSQMPPKMSAGLLNAIESQEGTYLSRAYESGFNRKYADRMARNYAEISGKLNSIEDPAAREAFLQEQRDLAKSKGKAVLSPAERLKRGEIGLYERPGQRADDFLRYNAMVEKILADDKANNERLAESGDKNLVELTRKDAEEVAAALLRGHDTSEGATPNPKGGGDAKLDRSVLMQRTLVDPTTRAFLGEVKGNPEALAAKTIFAQSTLASTAKFHHEVLTGTDDNGRPLASQGMNKSLGLTKQIPQDPSYGVLAGKWMTPANHAAITDLHGAGDSNWLMRAMKAITVPFKVANVPLTLAAHGRQWLSNGTFLGVANGVSPFNPKNWTIYREAWNAAKGEGKYADLMAENSLGHKSEGSPFKMSKQVADIMAEAERKNLPPVERFAWWLAHGLKRFPEKAGEMFAAGDMTFKAASFIKRYESNGHNAKEAAEWANALGYDYSRIPKAVSRFQDTPFAGPFIKFSAEQGRVYGNAWLKNPLAMLALHAAVKGLATGAVQRGLSKTGITGKWDDKDQKDWETMWPLLARYDREGTYSMPYRYKGGLNYLNLAALVGAEGIMRAIDPTGVGAGDNRLSGLASNVLGGAPPMEAYTVFNSGVDSQGVRKSREGAGTLERLKDTVKAVGPNYLGGTVWRDIPRVKEALTGEANPRTGETESLPAALAGLIGPRARQVFVDSAFAREMTSSRSDLEDRAKTAYRTLTAKGPLDPEARKSAREELTGVLKEMRERRIALEKALAAGMRLTNRNVTKLANDNIEGARQAWDNAMARYRHALAG